MGQVVLMDQDQTTVRGYTRTDGILQCDDVPLPVIAERVGTPCYVYSASSIRDRYTQLAAALAGIDVRLHYSVKANSNLAILSLLRGLGAGVDIVSAGELFRALQSGFTGGDVVFSGVGKTTAELDAAVRAGVKSINVESIGELTVLNMVAEQAGLVAPVALRVNPDVSVETPHPYTRTGQHGMKFGIPDDQVLEVARSMRSMRGVQLVGMAAHLGSQIVQPDPYAEAAQRLLTLCDAVRAEGIQTLQYMDIGGGLAVTYGEEAPMDLTAFADVIRPIAAASRLQLVMEPGRYLVANAGVLMTRVVYRKHSGGKEIVITDAGMNDLIRPALYKAYHAIDAVEARETNMTADIVGPVCESGDFFGLDRTIDTVDPGDLIAIRSAGAYSYAMASNYNSRPRPAEVLVDGARFAVVTERETYAELTRREHATPAWSDT